MALCETTPDPQLVITFEVVVLLPPMSFPKSMLPVEPIKTIPTFTFEIESA